MATSTSAYIPFSYWDGSYQIKTLTRRDEFLQAFHLRYTIFHNELRWVPDSQDQIERDDYDKNAVHFGVFNKEKQLLAFVRLILYKDTYMLENEFSKLVEDKHNIRKQSDTAEVSRLCISKGVRNKNILSNFGMHSITMLLYKGIYLWCRKNNIRYLYAVIEYKLYKLMLMRGFPCRLIGNPIIMQDKIKAVAVIFDWEEFRTNSMKRRPDMFKWFNQYSIKPRCMAFPTAWALVTALSFVKILLV